MTKHVFSLLVATAITGINGMQTPTNETTTQTDDPCVYRLGSLLMDCPKIQYKLACIAKRDAELAQAKKRPQPEFDTCYHLMRWHLEQALASQKILREHGEAQGSLTSEEYNYVRLEMAELLADGLGGEHNATRAKQLCEDVLKDESTPTEDLQIWAQNLLEKLQDEHAEEPQYGMQEPTNAVATQTDAPSVHQLGSFSEDCPKIQFDLGFIAHTEADLAQVRKRSQQEIDACHMVARWHLIQTLASQKVSYEKGETYRCIDDIDYTNARLWLAKLLAYGLGGERDAVQAKQLCEDLLADKHKLSMKTEFSAKNLLEKLKQENI